MRAVSFMFLLAVTFAAVAMAWRWRAERWAGAERVQRALAGRPPPPVPAPTRPASAAVPTPIPSPEKVKEAAARAEFYAAMLPEASEARRTKNTHLAELHRKQLRMDFLLKFGAFFRGRNLTDADREQLLVAWVTKELDMQDIRVVGREMSLSISDPALMESFAGVQKRTKETETAVLGPEGAAALAEYRQGQTMREVVMRLQGDAVLAGYPLTLEQADAVAAVLINSGVRAGRPARSLSQVDPDLAERLLAGVLSPEQRDLLLLPVRSSIASGKFTVMVYKLRENEMFKTPPPPAPTANAK